MVLKVGRDLREFVVIVRPDRWTNRDEKKCGLSVGASPGAAFALVVTLALIFPAGCTLNGDMPQPPTELSQPSGAASTLDPLSPAPDVSNEAARGTGSAVNADFDDQVRYADVDGDAMADMVFRKSDNTICVSLAQSSGFGAVGQWAAPGGTWKADQAFLVDVDGDGKSDLVFRDATNRIGVYLSTGTGFTTPTSWLALGRDYYIGQVLFADVDGNGMADLIFREVIADCSTTNVRRTSCPAGSDHINTSCRTRQVHCGRDEQCPRRTCSLQCQTCDTTENLKVGISTGSAFQALEDW